MSTVEDFENAPIGATATDADGNRAMKTDLGEWCWVFQNGNYLDDELMERRGYTLDAPAPAPATAREALDLAWELAHPVKEGQHIPDGVRLLDRFDSNDLSNDLSVYTTLVGFVINEQEALGTRTLDPLPEPEPDWTDAPAVIAVCNDTMDRDVFVRRGDNSWRSEFYGAGTADLRDVTPLYPKEGQDA